MSAFKGLQIGNMQSTKLAAKGEWYMVVSHRFGDLKEGFDNFFGLDNALTKNWWHLWSNKLVNPWRLKTYPQ